MTRIKTAALFATASLLGLATGATAQAAATDGNAATVDQLVVTAQKREQNLQDVPIVVTVLPRKLLQDTGVKDIHDLTVLVPGLTVNAGSSEGKTTARIRGVGTLGENSGLEPSVGVVIDGVYRPRTGVAFGDLGEIDQIEVLKGPQGTLFGKSTSAGVIDVTTRGPQFTFGADAEATVGNYGAKGASASVTGPIAGDVLAGRLFFAAGENDGFEDVRTGKGPSTVTRGQDRNYGTAKGELLFVPNSDVSVRLSADYSKRDEHCCGALQVIDGPTAPIINLLAAPFPGLASPPNPSARVEYANRPTDQVTTDGGVGVQANVKLPFGDLTSITALRQWKGTAGADADFTAADIIYRNSNQAFDQFTTFSQEIRLAGKTESLDWLVGAYYSNERLNSASSLLAGSDFEEYFSLLLSSGTRPNMVSLLTGLPAGSSYASGTGMVDHYTQQDRTAALFTNDTFHFTDKLDLTVGARFTADDKALNSNYANNDNAVGCAAATQHFASGAWSALGIPAAAQPTILGNLCLVYFNTQFNGRVTNQKLTENDWSGTAKLSYRWSPELMTYGSYARGYKAGGFNLDRNQSSNGLPSGGAGLTPVTDTSFPAEFVDSYELGAKSTLFDHTLLLNATAFYERFTDFQLNAFITASFFVRPIPEVTSKGVDLDVLWRTPLQGLSFQGGVTYANTSYGDQPVPNDPTNSLALLPGAQLPFAPLWSATGSATYSMTLTDNLKARFNIGAKYTSDYNSATANLPPSLQKTYTLVDARAVLAQKDDRWAVELWALNLFNHNYYEQIFTAPLQGATGLTAANAVYSRALDTSTYIAFPAAPRTFGVTLRAKF